MAVPGCSTGRPVAALLLPGAGLYAGLEYVVLSAASGSVPEITDELDEKSSNIVIWPMPASARITSRTEEEADGARGSLDTLLDDMMSTHFVSVKILPTFHFCVGPWMSHCSSWVATGYLD